MKKRGTEDASLDLSLEADERITVRIYAEETNPIAEREAQERNKLLFQEQMRLFKLK